MPKMPRLDARLAAAAALVKKGGTVADIGCDHGLLSIWLVTSGTCKKALACDLRPGPLAVAKKNCRAYNCEQLVDCRLGEGLSVVAEHEADTIVVAGVSALTISQIIEAAPWVYSPGVRLVMIPATKPEVLRRWLWQQGFALKKERLAGVAGRWYTAICAEYTGAAHEPSALACVVGATHGQPAQKAYLAQERVKLAKCRIGLADDSEEAAQADALLNALQ